MMTKLTRRGFLRGLLAAIPAVVAVAAGAEIEQTEAEAEEVNSLDISRCNKDDTIFFVRGNDEEGEIYYSEDNGITWHPIEEGYVFYTREEGETWATINVNGYLKI